MLNCGTAPNSEIQQIQHPTILTFSDLSLIWLSSLIWKLNICQPFANLVTVRSTSCSATTTFTPYIQPRSGWNSPRGMAAERNDGWGSPRGTNAEAARRGGRGGHSFAQNAPCSHEFVKIGRLWKTIWPLLSSSSVRLEKSRKFISHIAFLIKNPLKCKVPWSVKKLSSVTSCNNS